MNVVKSQWHCILCADSKEGGREENQDYFACVDTNFGFLFVVCDGMGGGPAGGNASMLAVQSIVMNVQNKPQGLNPKDVLFNAIVETNTFLRKNIKEHTQLMGMGTTCVVVLVTSNKAIIGHVGDSRLYHVRDGKMLFRTADHSVVGEMVRKGELSEEDARRAQNSNVITCSLGMRENVEPEIDVIDIKANDRIALCTDGVWGMMPEPDLVNALSSKGELPSILSNLMNKIELIGKSKTNSDYDNYTLGIIEVNPTKSNGEKENKHNKIWSNLLIVLLLVSILINAYQYFCSREHLPTQNIGDLLKNDTAASIIGYTQDEIDNISLENKFLKKQNEQLHDSISQLCKNIYSNKDSNKIFNETNKSNLLKNIITNLNKLKTKKGKNGNDILKEKRIIQRKIISDFEKYKKDSKVKCLVDLEKKIKSDKLIETQKDGASTVKSKEIIESVVNSLASLYHSQY